MKGHKCTMFWSAITVIGLFNGVFGCISSQPFLVCMGGILTGVGVAVCLSILDNERKNP